MFSKTTSSIERVRERREKLHLRRIRACAMLITNTHNNNGALRYIDIYECAAFMHSISTYKVRNERQPFCHFGVAVKGERERERDG